MRRLLSSRGRQASLRDIVDALRAAPALLALGASGCIPPLIVPDAAFTTDGDWVYEDSDQSVAHYPEGGSVGSACVTTGTFDDDNRLEFVDLVQTTTDTDVADWLGWNPPWGDVTYDAVTWSSYDGAWTAATTALNGLDSVTGTWTLALPYPRDELGLWYPPEDGATGDAACEAAYGGVVLRTEFTLEGYDKSFTQAPPGSGGAQTCSPGSARFELERFAGDGPDVRAWPWVKDGDQDSAGGAVVTSMRVVSTGGAVRVGVEALDGTVLDLPLDGSWTTPPKKTWVGDDWRFQVPTLPSGQGPQVEVQWTCESDPALSRSQAWLGHVPGEVQDVLLRLEPARSGGTALVVEPRGRPERATSFPAVANGQGGYDVHGRYGAWDLTGVATVLQDGTLRVVGAISDGANVDDVDSVLEPWPAE